MSSEPGIARVSIAAVLGVGLVTATTILGTWAAVLPGVTGAFRQPASPWSVIYVGSFAIVVAVVVKRSWRGGWAEVRAAASMLVGALGLRLSARRTGQVIALGVAAAVVIYALVVVMVATIPFPPAEGPDVRWEAVGAAPGWSAGLYFALFAAPAEELFYRGGLLVLVQGVRQLKLKQARDQVAVVLLLAVSSVLFGVAHLEHGVANVVTWGVAGVLLGGMALACGSVWPAVIAHCGANFLIAGVPSML